MKISIIIPTYKPKSYIWECLDSLVVQTLPYEDFEVILVLNGCKEPWETEIREYMSKHSELQVNFIQTDQGGVSNARNIALDVARGEYVTFIDDDDYVSPSYLKELYEKASQDTISLCYPYVFNDGALEIQLSVGITRTYNKLSHKGKQKYANSRKYFSGPYMKLIPISFIQNRRFDVRFKNGEDSLFNFLLSDKFKYVNYTTNNAVYYRRRRLEGAAFSSNLKQILQNYLRLANAYSALFWKSPFRYNIIMYLYFVIGGLNTPISKVMSKW